MQSNIDLTQEPDFEIVDLRVRPAACHVVAHDVTTRVEPKVMEVLILLARAEGGNISRDQLINSCWEGRVVTDDAITRTLSKARKVGMLTSPPSFRIETRPKVGVRLVSSSQSNGIDVKANGHTLENIEPLLIVFPFENLSTDPELQFFSDGVSEEVLSRIVRGSRLKVIGRASSFHYRGDQKAAAAVALQATHMIEGTVRRSGDRVRINVQLTDISTGAGLWADKFDRDLRDIFALQDEIADNVARSLLTTFDLAGRTPIDPAIYDLYLRAKNLEGNPDRLFQRIATLERVTQSAPNFADGWGRLASLRAYVGLNLPYAARGLIKAQALDAFACCREIDSLNLESNYATYWLTAPFGEFTDQERIIQKSLHRDNPTGDDLAMAAFHYCNVGLRRRCRNYASRAWQIDPSNWSASINYASSLWGWAPSVEVFAVLRAHIAAFPEDQHGTAYLLLVASLMGNWDEIDRLTDPKRLAQFPLREHQGLLMTAATMRYPTPENRRFLFDMMKARAEKIGASDCVVISFAAMIGMADDCYTSFAQLPLGPAGTKGDTLGLMGHRTYLLFTPANEKGRADPRFVKLCARLGLVDYWLKNDLWPDCASEVPYDFYALCEQARDEPVDCFDRFVRPEPRPHE